MLVPETTKVGSRPSGVGSNSAPTVMLSGPGFEPSDTEVFLSSSFNDTFVVPAWAVRSTPGEAAANMGWEYITVDAVQVVGVISPSATRVGDKKQAVHTPSGAVYQLSLPVKENRKALATDDELLSTCLQARRSARLHQRRPSHC